MALQILQNAAFISFLALGIYSLWRPEETRLRLTDQLLVGLNFGLIAFLVTSTPITMPDGATIDARAGPVILAGTVGGPPAALVAAGLGGAARAWVGGSFSLSGVVVFLFYAAAGTLTWTRLFRSTLGDGVTARRIVAGLVLSLIGASLMYFVIQPRDLAVSWVENNLLLIAVANSVSVLFTGLVSFISIHWAKQRHALEAAHKTLNLAKMSGGIGIWDMNLVDGTIYGDENNLRLHGLQLKDERRDRQHWSDAIHPDDRDRVNREFASLLDGTAPFDTTYRAVHPDGSVHHLKANALVQRSASGAPVRAVGANIDLTPMVEKEEELERSRQMTITAQKLETVGQLSGGIAHDFNNLLAIIHGNIELLLEDEGRNALSATERLDCLTSAIAAARRGSDLTRGLLTYARKSYLDPQPLSINDTVRETERWLTRTIPTSIRVQLILQPGIWTVRLDPASLQSAIVNIIVNARDAMPSGGTLTIETRNVAPDADPSDGAEPPVPPGRYVRLAFSDSGTGIDAALLPDVFEPFVSSKSLGIGTGLGLSVVKGFVEQSGGHVRLSSTVGVGTCVTMYFPAVAAEPADIAAPDRAQADRSEPVAPGQARILVAEDELEILSVILRILKTAGYRADAVASGDAALKLFQSDPSFDLLLTDIVMPGALRGPDLARECRTIRPDLPVIFLSGYANEATVHGNGLQADDVRLTKPVAKTDLIQSIEASLHRARPRKST